ncbi:hypothetical protein [Nocardia asteroides]|uniref:hypothetical protein n=1 Tax=Nocardia asteroides TaxID=1824 RepID=UPI0033DEF349
MTNQTAEDAAAIAATCATTVTRRPTDAEVSMLVGALDAGDPMRMLAEEVADLRAQVAHTEQECSKAYRDRAELLAVLAVSMPAQLVFGADPDAPTWPVLFIDTPAGQASWHINPADTDLFPIGIWRKADADDVMVWDGHNDREKSWRLREFVSVLRTAREAHA